MLTCTRTRSHARAHVHVSAWAYTCLPMRELFVSTLTCTRSRARTHTQNFRVLGRDVEEARMVGKKLTAETEWNWFGWSLQDDLQKVRERESL